MWEQIERLSGLGGTLGDLEGSFTLKEDKAEVKEEKVNMKEAASKVKEEENGAKDKREKSTKLKMNLLPNEHSLLKHLLS